MLHVYTSFRILFQESTASIQDFLKLTLHLLRHSIPKHVALSWRNAPPCLKNVSLFAMERCKKVMLYYNSFWIYYCFQWIVHRLRELSYWVSLCCWHFQRNTAPSGKELLHLFKYASCYYMCLRIQHYTHQKSAASIQRLSFKAKLVKIVLLRVSLWTKWYNLHKNDPPWPTGETLSKSCSIAFCYKAMWHVLKEIPHNSPQSIPKCQFTGTYMLWLNISNLDRNVYVRIQHSKIPRFAQDSLGECWKPDIQKIEKLNPKERSWASSFPEENSFA